MAKRMLIDATHAEETRVAIIDQNRLVDFEYENKLRRQLKGNIFLAKITRVEPSLQAAFVNFGGNRHGFLPFSEIHPDYFRIPIADREAILAEQRAALEAMRAAEEAEDAAWEASQAGHSAAKSNNNSEAEASDADAGEAAEASEADSDSEADDAADGDASAGEKAQDDGANGEDGGRRQFRGRGRGRGRNRGRRSGLQGGRNPEVVGEDGNDGPQRPSLRRNYKIQEVIKRGQILLIQVQKEERGNKGAAVTTYLSLPGRYSVLMPNSPRGGGVSRKIANFSERKRMREILAELEAPDGMSVILRTAGMSRTKVEIKRDLDYLMRLWDEIRDLTLRSTAPAMVYEEGNLVKRAIRDLYDRDIEEVIIEGEEAFKDAKRIMKMLMPSHVKKVISYTDPTVPIFHKYQLETQLNQIGDPNVTLKSGGYLVIHPTEALVSVDVNSGRATKERHIEETALKTNLEAAEEVARQLRLRDLGGLIVIDFIDMEDNRNNAKVEQRLKQALAGDRARIQVGRISNFGLMELSRQRLNPSLTEAQFRQCEHCAGMGVTRTTDSAAIMALRAIEEEGIKNKGLSTVTLKVPADVAIYILNHKRHLLAAIEGRYGFAIAICIDDTLRSVKYQIESVRALISDDDDHDEDNHDHLTGEAADAATGETGQTQPRENREPREQREPREDREGREGGRGRRRRGGRGRGDRQDRGDRPGSEEVTGHDGSDMDAEAAPSGNARRIPIQDNAETGAIESGADTASDDTKKVRNAPRGRGRGRDKDAGQTAPVAEEGQASEAATPNAASAAKVKPAAKTASPAAEKTDTKARQFFSRKREDGEAQQAPRAVAVGEVINEDTGPKKKGWWRRGE
ncbi:MAG: ribonuclease E/G [Pseudomonadota bacterium]